MTSPTHATLFRRSRAARRAFVHPLLLATIAFGGATGLGAVWVRQQIAVTAGRTLVQTKRLAQAERALAETNTDLTAELARLERRNTDWNLGLLPPREPQLVRVTAADERLFAGRGAVGRFGDFAPPVAAPGSFSLRLVASTRAR